MLLQVTRRCPFMKHLRKGTVLSSKIARDQIEKTVGAMFAILATFKWRMEGSFLQRYKLQHIFRCSALRAIER